MRVRVEHAGADTYQVIVEGAATQHSVTVTAEYWQNLTGSRIPVKSLIAKSFEFLLERESNTSIVRSFDLPVIQRYFPEYERTIGARLDEYLDRFPAGRFAARARQRLGR